MSDNYYGTSLSCSKIIQYNIPDLVSQTMTNELVNPIYDVCEIKKNEESQHDCEKDEESQHEESQYDCVKDEESQYDCVKDEESQYDCVKDEEIYEELAM